MRKRLSKRNGSPKNLLDLRNNPQPPAIIKTKYRYTVVTLPQSGMNEAGAGMTTEDRLLTQSIIQNKVLMDIAGLLNAQQYLGQGIPFTPQSSKYHRVEVRTTTESDFPDVVYRAGRGLLKPIPNTGTPPEALENMVDITNDRLANTQHVTLPDTGEPLYPSWHEASARRLLRVIAAKL